MTNNYLFIKRQNDRQNEVQNEILLFRSSDTQRHLGTRWRCVSDELGSACTSATNN